MLSFTEQLRRRIQIAKPVRLCMFQRRNCNPFPSRSLDDMPSSFFRQHRPHSKKTLFLAPTRLQLEKENHHGSVFVHTIVQWMDLYSTRLFIDMMRTAAQAARVTLSAISTVYDEINVIAPRSISRLRSTKTRVRPGECL